MAPVRGTEDEIFFNEDESEAVVFERYRDADAAIEHFTNIGHLMEPIMATPPSRRRNNRRPISRAADSILWS